MLRFFKWYEENVIFGYISIACTLALYFGGSYCEHFPNTTFWPIYIFTPIVVEVFAFIIFVISKFALKLKRQ